MTGEVEGEEFLCGVCNLFRKQKQNAVSCSAASPCRSTMLKFLFDDAHHRGGRGREREAADRSLISPSFLSVFLLTQVTEKLLEVENETMMKVADLEKLLLHKDKELQVIRVRRQLLMLLRRVFLHLNIAYLCSRLLSDARSEIMAFTN